MEVVSEYLIASCHPSPLMFCALLLSVLFATFTRHKSTEPPISDEDLLATQYDHITRQIAKRWRHEHKNEL